MRRADLFTGGVYQAKEPRGRDVRVVAKVDARRGLLNWGVPGWAIRKTSDGRRLRAGRRCRIETFIRWARGIAQLDLFGAPAQAPAYTRGAGPGDRPAGAPADSAGPAARCIGRGSAPAYPGPALLQEASGGDD